MSNFKVRLQVLLASHLGVNNLHHDRKYNLNKTLNTLTKFKYLFIKIQLSPVQKKQTENCS